MSEIAIQVHNISKCYALQQSRDNTLKSRLAKLFNQPNPEAEQDAIYWALKNVTFQVNRGEVLGIIGRNGAGKSTLLKILARVVRPSSGKVELRGKISALLEVGTGFHPDLSGRENIFFNGILLGMQRKEVKAKLDQIVEFAGIHQYLDSPVKYYSSGMYVRLAFSIAAHLDPEILLVDEVLSVGDIAFQKKCLGKIGEVVAEGRTVLFVSHNMESVSRLCHRSIFLQKGKVEELNNSGDVIQNYLQSNFQIPSRFKAENSSQTLGNHILRIWQIEAIGEEKEPRPFFYINQKIGIRIRFELLEGGLPLTLLMSFFNEQDSHLFDSLNTLDSEIKTPKQKGLYETTLWIPPHLFNHSFIIIGLSFLNPEPYRVYHRAIDLIGFQVRDHLQSITRGSYQGAFPGLVRPHLDWEPSSRNF